MAQNLPAKKLQRKGFFNNSIGRLLLIVSFVILTIGLPIGYFIYKGSNAAYSWYNNAWQYRKPISVANSGTLKTNFDVLISVDTSSLISGGKIQSDCDDIRFVDSDDTTVLSYWIETGCNTATTQVWVRVPSLPNGGKTIYMYYGNGSATNSQLSWAGNIIMLRDSACPVGWTRSTDFDSKFPYGDTVYGGTSGSATHSHANASGNTTGITSGSRPSNGNLTDASGGGSHTHSYLLGINTFSAVLPPYVDTVFCYAPTFLVPANNIAIYKTLPVSGWTRFTALDSVFARGGATYGPSGGSGTHTHPISNNNTGSGIAWVGCKANSQVYTLSASHTHLVNSQSTAASSNMPPYLSVIYGQSTSQANLPSGAIVMSTALPPLGWTRLTDLDGKLPFGSAAYGTAGGALTHSHTFSFSVGGTYAESPTCGSAGSNAPTIAGTHTHTLSGSTDVLNHLPPVRSTLFIEKNTNSTVGVSNTIGAEDSNVPQAPGSTAANALSTTSIRWNFTDNSINETGFKVFDMAGNLKVTCVGADLSYCDETGLSPNTQYIRQFKAYNNDGDSLSYSDSVSRFTFAPVPSLSVDSVQIDEILISSSVLVNETEGQSGVYFDCVDTSCDNGEMNTWIQTFDMSAAGLQANTSYGFRVKARNGDGVETAYSDVSYAFTLAPVPEISINNIDSQTVGITVTNFTGMNEGDSAVLIECLGNCTSSGVWQADGTEQYSGLDSNSNYGFRAKARNGDSIQTVVSSTVNHYTLASAPLAPSLSNPTTDSLKVTLNSDLNGNPSNTEFALRYGTSGSNYVNPVTGLVQTGEYWGTLTDFGSTTGVTVNGLQEGISHSFSVKARNFSLISTAFSSPASLSLPLVPPTITGGSALGATSIRWTFTDNTLNESGYKVYDLADNLMATCVGVNLTHCDETGLSPNIGYTRKVRAFNDDTESGFSGASLIYTRTNTPGAPTVQFGLNSATLTINPNGNPSASTYYSIYENGIIGKYLQSDGSFDVAEVKRTIEEWGEVAIGDLSENTQYVFLVKAENDDGSHQTVSPSTTGYTLTTDISSPSATGVTTSSVKLFIDGGSNPAITQYAVLHENTGQYVNRTTGELQSTEDWGTYLQWNGSNGIIVDGFTSNTQQNFRVKARNGDGVEGTFSGIGGGYTLVNSAAVPTIQSVSATVLKVIIQAGGNPANTEFALQINDSTFINYQTGSAQVSRSWATLEQWGGNEGVGVVGLAPSTSYDFRVYSRNLDNVEAPATANVSKFTLANTPGVPVITRISSTNASLVLSRNGNPFTVEYVIQEATSGKYVNTSGALVDNEIWGTYAEFGGNSGVLLTTLEPGTLYDFRSKARNGDQLESGYSVTGGGYTSLGTPTILTPTVLDSSTIRWNFSENIDTEVGFRIFSEDGTQVAQCAQSNITYCDEYGLDSNTQYVRKIAAYDNSGNGDFSNTMSAVTFALVPSAPTVEDTSSTSLLLKVITNGNNSNTEFAVRESVSNLYLNPQNASLEPTPVWAKFADWGGETGKTVAGLFANARYTFDVKSRNSENVESVFSSSASRYTQPAAVLNPTVEVVSDVAIKVKMNNGGNNSITQFNIKESDGKFAQKSGGNLVVNSVWGTYAEFGGNNGVIITGLTPNTMYGFSVSVRNGDGIVSQSTAYIQATTNASRPDSVIVTVQSPRTVNIRLADRYSSSTARYSIWNSELNRFISTDGSLVSDPIWGTYNQWGGAQGITVSSLVPGKAYTFLVKTRNLQNTETAYSDGQAQYTYALVPEKPVATVVSTTGSRIIIIDPGNDSSVQYAIQELNSKKFVSKEDGTLKPTASWGTISEFGGSTGFLVKGLQSASDYEFRVRARNGNSVESTFGETVPVQTNAIVYNQPSGVTVTLKDNNEVNVTTLEGSQRGEEELSVNKFGVLVAQLPVKFDSDKDWSNVTIDVNEELSKAVVKIGSINGLNGKFTLFVPIKDTDSLRVCPSSSSLSEVTSECPSSVIFDGDFPQTKVVEDGDVTVSRVEKDGKLYWSVSGLTGTGALGEKKGKGPTESPTPSEPQTPTDEVPQEETHPVLTPSPELVESISKISNTTVKSVATAVLVDAPKSTVLAMQSVSKAVDATPIGNLNQPELVVVTTTVTTAAVSVGLAAFAGGFSNIPYLVIQAVISILSFFGFVKKVRPYGLVYDSVTKKPINRAVVRIYNASEKLVWTDVTTAFGTFGANLPVGRYKILVVKPGYKYPSNIVSGHIDYPLEPVYHGEVIKFNRRNEFNLVIPMDPRERSEFIIGLAKVLSNASVIVKFGHILLFVLGLTLGIHTVIKYPSSYNLFALLMYLPALYLLLKNIFVKQKSMGIVVDRDGKPISGVTVTLKEMRFDKYIAKRITDRNGEYQFIVPNGTYQLGILDDVYRAIRYEGGSSLISKNRKGKELVVDKGIIVRKK